MQSQTQYTWKRFWCPRDGYYSLSDGGYLSDPDSEFGHFSNPFLKTLSDLSDIPCLILLGEPGTGKSFALDQEQAKIDENNEDQNVLWIDLKEYGSEDRLIRELFENRIFLEWYQGGNRLTLFLDSLDECMMRIETVADILAVKFENIRDHLHRLNIRIACRTADWTNYLEQKLRTLWNDPERKDEHFVHVYELVPLRRIDVLEAARVENIDSKAFLNEVNRVSAVPFAIKPIILKVLFNIFKQGEGSLPNTKSEIYEKGCLLLCEDIKEGEKAVRSRWSTDVEARLAIASRIAAMTMICNRTAIWTNLDQGNVPQECIPVSSLCGGTESGDDITINTNETSVREALSTGLFSSRGQNMMGWAHQTYAEFLTARWLSKGFNSSQITDIVFHQESIENKVIPQLREVISWLASINEEIFHALLESEPEVLISSDSGFLSHSSKEALIKVVLERYESGKWISKDIYDMPRFDNIKYPGLIILLRSYLLDNSKQVNSRKAAIYIANDCRLKELQNDIVDIALNPNEPYSLRIAAA